MSTPPTASPTAPAHEYRILRRADVLRQLSISRTALYAMIAAGDFPKQIRMGPKSVGWLAHEVDAWLAARMAERG